MQWLLGVLLSVGVVWGAPSEGGKGQIWAVLVAGSSGYDNYRHQADICHAYQIFHRHGIPDSKIIVMMYDDIAQNAENPRKGVIINKPGGPNVYGPKKVNKDYIEDQVTPQNFLHVLTGNSKAVEEVGSGKVLKSGPNDHVFVYFADHGGTGLIGFPNGYLYAKDLIKALKTMYQKKMYKRLVFYLEACESGSMFDKILPTNINIFATTAANPDESSYGCYWDDTVKAYLGDEYSVAWMEDIDSEEHHKNITTETLRIQFNNVVKRVAESHPQMYGEKQYQKDHVKDYIGASKNANANRMDEVVLEPFKDSVSARDILLHTLNRKLELTNSEEETQMLLKKKSNLLKGRKQIDDLFARVIRQVTNNDEEDISAIEKEHQPLNMEMMSCYQTVVDTFNNECVNINKNTYVLGHLNKFANLCVTEYTTPENIVKAVNAECDSSYKNMDGVH